MHATLHFLININGTTDFSNDGYKYVYYTFKEINEYEVIAFNYFSAEG
jgi:hypothetical protein